MCTGIFFYKQGDRGLGLQFTTSTEQEHVRGCAAGGGGGGGRCKVALVVADVLTTGKFFFLFSSI